MTQPGLEQFPPWLQALLSVLTFLGALVVYWRGALTKPVKSSDVVVPQLNVMDGSTIRDAAQILRETLQHQRNRDHDIEEVQRELRRHTELLESIDGRLRRRNQEAG